MEILLAEDEIVSRRILEVMLKKWGYNVVIATDGAEAWDILQKDNAPRIAILDWMMPKMDGLDVCKLLRESDKKEYTYIIILTAKDKKEDIVAALDAGADDFVNKPFDRAELESRIKVGTRVVNLENALSNKINDLQNALNHVKQLQGLLPMCSYCKKVRDDKNYWHQVEEYITVHADAKVSHGVCPDCYDRIVKPEIEALKKERQKQRELEANSSAKDV